jgi:ferrous iron transport protein B
MSQASAPLKVALAGNPNCGKTALFNALTGGKQKVGNYPGVTVERKEGRVKVPSKRSIYLLDLPGTYSLEAQTPDEVVTREVLLGTVAGETRPEGLIAVADAGSLERNLNLILELRSLGIPTVLALNMMDLALSRGLDLDLDLLAKELGVPVVPTVATRGEGIDVLVGEMEKTIPENPVASKPVAWVSSTPAEIEARFKEVDRILAVCTRKSAKPTLWTDRIDRIVVHPVWGSLILIFLLALMFQAIFDWAQGPQNLIQAGVKYCGDFLSHAMADGPLRSLLVNGVISGAGSVLVFLPQILLLFAFILLLEDSGYMSRAAFLMDRVMGRVGLNGRAFIPLLSSFACAVPGIMATRTIAHKRDRLLTILIAPLTTCSARLPVYSLLIAAFIPNREVLGFLHLQGLVMLALYAAGVIVPLAIAALFRATLFRGPTPPLLMELPTYKWPNLKGVFLGILERCKLFVWRAGTVILLSSVILWFLSSYPQPSLSNSSHAPDIHLSYAGRVGDFIEPVLRPIGFNWQIAIALIPGFAAREVMIGALGTVYAVQAGDDKEGSVNALSQVIAKDWSVATGLSLIVWYILACQCLSTLAVTRRETNSYRWPIFMLTYMTVLAYGGSFLTFHLAKMAGLG